MVQKQIVGAIAFLLLAVLFAGCLGGEDIEAEDREQTRPGSLFSETEGGVRGAVSTDLFEPIGNANVHLLTMAREPTGKETTTDSGGEFAFALVEPGDYIIYVTAVGYETFQQALNVQAGKVTEVRGQLVALPTLGPYYEEFDRAGYVTWAAAWQAEPPGVGCITMESPVGVMDPKSCGGLRGGGGDAGETRVGPDASGADSFQTDLSEVKTLIVEMRWSPAGPLGEHFQLDMMCADAPRGAGGAILDTEHPCYELARGSNPLTIRFDEEHWLEHGYNFTGTWAARVFATYGMLGTYGLTGIDAGAAYEQTFEKYWTIFHREPAPEGFSRLPDA